MRNSCQIKIMNILNTFTCHPVQIFQVDIALIQNSTSICIRVILDIFFYYQLLRLLKFNRNKLHFGTLLHFLSMTPRDYESQSDPNVILCIRFCPELPAVRNYQDFP